jgi:hypothetical protein
VLICPTKAGLTARDAIVAGAQQRQRRLLEQLGNEELEMFPGLANRLTGTAAQMLDAERDLR